MRNFGAVRTPQRIKTFAELKRTFKPGQRWHCFNHIMNKDLGERPIKRVQSNAITFEMPGGRESWFYFPKAKEVKFIDDKTIEIYEDATLCMTYRLVGDGES